MSARGAAVGLAVAVLGAATGADARPPVEVQARRGVGGVVAAGGLDVVEIEVRSAADVARRDALVIGGVARPVALAARGTAIVTLARRVPPGAAGLPALALEVRGAGDHDPATGVIPAARVVARPVIVVTDDPAALLPRVDAWRRGEGLGDPVAVAPDGLPARWQALVGVGALVLDRPAAALAPDAARLVARYLAAGGTVCRLEPAGAEARPTCVRAAPLAIPRTRQRASIAGALGALGWIALVVAAGLGLAALAPGRRWGWRIASAAGVLGLGAGVPFVRLPDTTPAVRGVRAAAGGGEDWIAAEFGAGALGGAVALGGDLWIEPSAPVELGAAPSLDDAGLRGRLPGPGSWRVRGFVAAGARGWTDRLARVPRAAPEAP